MHLLHVDKLTKYYGPEAVLDGASFDLFAGERLALVGPNGTGKTTLLKILAGQLDADSGNIEPHPTIRIGYLEQHPEFGTGRTLWEEASLGLADELERLAEVERLATQIAEATDPTARQRLVDRFDRLQQQIEHQGDYQLDYRIERVLVGLGFNSTAFQQSIDLLSGGQRNRLLLAKLLLAEPDVLLLDEPTNHLDIAACQWLENYLAGCRQAMVIVSHDRYLLDRVATRTLELFRGTIDSFPGNFTAYWGQKEERIKVQRRTYENQQEYIAKTEDFIRRNNYGQKHAQAEDRKKKLARVERVEPPREIHAPAMGFPPASRSGDIVLRVEHVSKAFAQPLFDDVSFDMIRGQRWGILGPNGSGKTTLLRILMGREPADAGQVILGAGVNRGYYDQMLTALDPQAEVVEAVRPPTGEFNIQQRRDLLGRFGLSGDIVFQAVKSLSGGERSRVALAQLAATEPNLLILDEPTNHLDLWARDALERSLLKFDGSTIVVSHDRYFLNRVVDHLLVLDEGEHRVIDGNYDTYLMLNREPVPTKEAALATGRDDKSAATSGGRQVDKAATKVKRKRRFPYRKVADIEADIMQRESRIEEIHELMIQPETLRAGDRIRQLQTEIVSQQEALAQLYEHYEEAVELN